jgi:two-component system, NtrC family, sensor kinase
MVRSNLTLRTRLLLSIIGVVAFAGFFAFYLGTRLFHATRGHAAWIIFLLLLSCLLVGVVSSFVLKHFIMKPVNALMVAIEEIAAGPVLREVKLDHAPPELQALALAFSRMQEAIRERRRLNEEKLIRSDRLAMIGQLAAGVAHEINNPLGSILLLARLGMQQSTGDSKLQENLERIEKETKRCHAIVQSLLDFARQREPDIEPVDVNQLLDATIQFFERQHFFQNIKVTRRYNNSLPAVHADCLQLQQVLMNIVINAADAMNGQGTLTLETADSGRDIDIFISDTGCGISPENLNRIFDPFFTTKEVGKGTGLGLSVSYGIIQAHNGEIRVSSTPGAGSRFAITLPKVRESV